MAEITGETGDVTLVGGYISNVKSWTLEYEGEAVDSTDFASVGVRDFIPGLTSWRGTYNCSVDDTVILIAPGAAAAALVLTASAGRTYTGDAIVTNLAIAVTPEAINELVVSFQGTGILGIA